MQQNLFDGSSKKIKKNFLHLINVIFQSHFQIFCFSGRYQRDGGGEGGGGTERTYKLSNVLFFTYESPSKKKESPLWGSGKGSNPIKFHVQIQYK